VFDTMLPDAVQVADPFHVVRVANTALDECRRRVQNETAGHRGRKPDPLYRARRLLTIAAERLPDQRRERLVGLLAAGDPKGEVKLTWHAKEVVRQIYDHTDPQLAEAWVDEIIRDFADRTMPPEVRRLGRTIKRWRDQIVAWPAHTSPTDRPKRSTSSSSVSSESRSGCAGSATTASAPCSTPDDPTGTSSTPSPHHEIRRATFHRDPSACQSVLDVGRGKHSRRR
jgi:hypothetical protein